MIPANTDAIIDYVGNDTASVFSFPFRALIDDEVNVYVEDSVGVQTALGLTTDYTLVRSSFPSLGGSVTLVNASQAWLTAGKLKTGYTLYIEYNVKPRQAAKFRDGGPLTPVEIEKALDKLTSDISGMLQVLERALTLPPSEAGTNPSFPPMTGNADKILQVNATADGFKYGPTVTEVEGWKDAAELARDEAQAAQAASEAASTASSGYATASMGYRDQAQAYNATAFQHKTDAETARNAAVVAQTAAETAETNAETAQAASEAARDLSEYYSSLMLFATEVIVDATMSPYDIGLGMDDMIFKVDCTLGAVTINLNTRPTDSNTYNIAIVKTDNSANAITVEAYGADTINGSANITIDDMSYGRLFTPGLASDWKAREFIVEGAGLSAIAGSSGGIEVFNTVQDIASGGKITPTSSLQQLLKVQGDAGDQDAHIVPFLANPIDGTIIVLLGMDDAKILKMSYNDNTDGLMIKGDMFLGKGNSLTLIYDATGQRYWEIARS